MRQRTHHVAVIAALLGVATWQAAIAAEPVTRDLALTQDGSLQGQVFTSAGQPHTDAQVLLVAQNGAPRAATTDANGKFQFAGVQPGVYHLASAGHGGMVRVWQARQAPPNAHDAALIATGPIQRGQGGAWNNPLWMTGLVALAIALPLTLANKSGS
ncbi:MAG: carboxypeptidase regulatory-like domain-containing protein [Planctomycetales bacterium]|nr:carboxypeptidase regulatory-like domain-containing protein [Planctomycetales bacterium]